MEFHKLTCHGNEMSITHKKPFDTAAKSFKPETIKKVFDFAFDMTFGDKGAHRVHRTGGSVYRKKGEIFSNTFQGKLAECAACNLLYKVDKRVFPDFLVSQLGVWEHNERAKRFYQKNGFYRIGEHSFVVGDDVQIDYVMRKDL